MYLLLGIIFIVIGLVMLINPDLIYDITEGWKNSSVNTYPSDLYVKSQNLDEEVRQACCTVGVYSHL